MNKKLIAIAIATAMSAPVMAADLKISGRVNQQFISTDTDGGTSTLNNTDNGHQRLQFDVKEGNAFGRIAYDARESKNLANRDMYIGYKFDSVSVQYGRMGNAGKNIEKDPLIATFLETRASAANAAGGPGKNYSSNGFLSEILELKFKAGGATIKVQAGLSDNDVADAATKGDANQGHIGVSVTGKAGGVRWWIANNNGEADGANADIGTTIGTASDQSVTKLGASMKFGKVQATLDIQSAEVDGFTNDTTTIRANMGLGGGAKVYGAIGLRSNDAGSAGDATWLRLAYSKSLSKGVTAYAGYTSTDYDAASTETDVSVIGAGMTIKF